MTTKTTTVLELTDIETCLLFECLDIHLGGDDLNETGRNIAEDIRTALVGVLPSEYLARMRITP